MNNLRKRIAIILFLVTTASLVICGIWVYGLYQRAFKVNSNVVESYHLIRAANQTLISISEAALEVSLFLYTDDKDVIRKLPEIIISTQVNVATLSQLIKNDPEEITLYEKLNPLIDKKIKFLQSTVTNYSTGNKEAAIKLASDPTRLELTNAIAVLVTDIKAVEMNRLEKMSLKYQLKKITADKYFILLGQLNVLLVLLTFFVCRPFLD